MINQEVNFTLGRNPEHEKPWVLHRTFMHLTRSNLKMIRPIFGSSPDYMYWMTGDIGRLLLKKIDYHGGSKNSSGEGSAGEGWRERRSKEGKIPCVREWKMPKEFFTQTEEKP